MNIIFKFITVLAGLLMSITVLADQTIWTTSGFKMPESVEYDAKNNRYYVSNINDGVAEQDGNGSISILDGNGKLIKADWITGLHSPKGLSLHNNKLYVADVKQLVVIDIKKEKIVAQYEANDSMILNGISINESGKVFVSDWLGNSIYTLENEKLRIWLKSTDLNSPNGLWADEKYLYVASWGKNPNLKKHFATETSGNIKKISLKDKTIETLKLEKWVNMDGISSLPENKWLVSDFMKGQILLINDKGEIEKTITSKKGSADFFYIREKNLVVVPLLMDGQVVAYSMNN